MDNYYDHESRKRVSRKVLRRRQLGALAVIAFLVLLFVILVAKGCSSSGEGKGTEGDVTTTTTTAPVITTAPVTTTTAPVTTINPKASNVKLSTRELFLDIGETGVSIIQSYPDAGTGEANEVWTSMDPSIATVDKYGYVTGVAKGQTYIILSFNNYPDIEIEIKVYVADDGTLSAADTTDAGASDDGSTTTVVANVGVAALPDERIII